MVQARDVQPLRPQADAGFRMNDWNSVWDDQARFNRYFRGAPHNPQEVAAQTQEISLALIAEVMELLGTVAWKKHRDNTRHRPNMAHTHEELVDIYKFFITLAQIHGMTPDILEREYWRKSAVCEQRYIEEKVSAFAKQHPIGRVAFVDLDNTIFDYTDSFGRFILTSSIYASEIAFNIRANVETYVRNRDVLTKENTGIPAQLWEDVKHLYRSSNRTARMHPMPDASEFLQVLKSLEYLIVLVTARPIDRYPNLMTDTIEALNFHDLPFDHIWYGLSKKVVLAERLDPLPSVCMAVDDDPAHVKEYIELGIPTFHVVNGSTWMPTPEGATRVLSLRDAIHELSILG